MKCNRCGRGCETVDVLHNGYPDTYCRDCIADISKRPYAETLVIFWSERVLKGELV